MIRIRFVRAAVLPTLLMCGCSSMSPTDKGVLGGGAIGAGTGAVVGHALGNTGAGAVIGGVVGAVSGGLIGNAVEKKEEREAVQAAATQAQIGMGDVIQMVHSHVSDSVIISQIRSSGTVYHLTGDDVRMLKQNGVSDVVVQEMMATAYRYPRRVYSEAPAYGSTVYVVEPSPPPVAIGFGYTRYGGRCH